MILFLLTYGALLVFSKLRAYIALACAAIFAFLLKMTPGHIFSEAIGGSGLNVLLMIAGTMALVVLFTESKMPNRMVDMIIRKSPNGLFC